MRRSAECGNRNHGHIFPQRPDHRIRNDNHIDPAMSGSRRHRDRAKGRQSCFFHRLFVANPYSARMGLAKLPAGNSARIFVKNASLKLLTIR